jgi:outer membrane usher protein
MAALAFVVLTPARGLTAVLESRDLQLEVMINDTAANLIGSFTNLPDGRMAARRTELEDIGIKVPASAPEDPIIIDDLAGVTYRYDEAGQKIFFTLGNGQRIAKVYDLRGRLDEPTLARSDIGAVLNYLLFASSVKSSNAGSFGFSGANATLDARAFGPFGTLSQSAILGVTTSRQTHALRLDTTWTTSDPESLRTYRAGDVISGGFAWTRPIRLGGLQKQRDFTLRPDLVTQPLPAASGSAAVPSALDVYVNNVKTYSQDIPAGPYEITNIPSLSAAGSAQIVLRDATGHETQTNVPFYASPNLLRGGLYDFSIETGVPRLNYGVDSNDYVATPVGSASLRGGFADWLTGEAHAEGSGHSLNLGLGTVTGLGSWGALSLAGSGSRFGAATGFQSYAAIDTQLLGLNIHASSQRTFGSYNDLASITANNLQSFAAYPGLFSLGINSWSQLMNAQPPKVLDTVSVGLPLPFDKSSISAGYVHLLPVNGTASNLVTLSYSRSLFDKATAYITAFTDISNRKNTGVFLGLSMPLDNSPSSLAPTSISSSLSRSNGNTSGTVQATKSLVPEPGNYGYDLRDSEGTIPDRYAAASYRSSIGQIDGYVQQFEHSFNATLQAQGAIATMGGDVFLSNRIDDSFAVVDAGAPGVEVFHENRPAGWTDSQGLALIPALRSYQANKISIDPLDLPLTAEASLTENVIAPPNRSGILVPFGVNPDTRAAMVILTHKDGQFIRAGANAHLEDGGEAFVVGYDGRAYIKGLGPANTVVVSDSDTECRASFSYDPQRNSQVTIGPIVCQ